MTMMALLSVMSLSASLKRGLVRILPLVIVLMGILWPDLAFAEDAADVAVGMAEEAVRSSSLFHSTLACHSTALTFLPAMLLVTTPFTRFIIVFSMLRQALGCNSLS